MYDYLCAACNAKNFFIITSLGSGLLGVLVRAPRSSGPRGGEVVLAMCVTHCLTPACAGTVAVYMGIGACCGGIGWGGAGYPGWTT